MHATRGSPPPGLRRPFVLLGAAGFVSGLSIRVAEPLLPKVAEEFDVSVAAASVLITAFTLAYGVFQLVHGPLGDRFGKLRAVTAALLSSAVASAACAFAASLEDLALYRFLTGMTAGAVIPLGLAYVGDNVPFAERQSVLGRFIAGILLGATLGPLLGGALSDHVGWRTTFLVPAAGFLAIGLALATLARREAPASDARTLGIARRYRQILRSSKVRWICLAVGVEGFLFYGAFGYFGAFLRHEFSISYTAIGLILAGFGAGGVLYSVLVKTLVHRVGPERMVRLGAWLLAAGFVAIALSPVWLAAVPAIALLGFAFYLLHNTLQTRATEMAPQARGSGISLFAFSLFFGQALGVFACGLGVASIDYRPVFALTGLGLAALSIAVMRRLASW